MTALMALLFSGCKTKNAGEGALNQNPAGDQSAMDSTGPDIAKPGIVLNLPEDFSEYTGISFAEKYDYLYANGQIGIGINRIGRTENYTLEDYVNQEAGYYQADKVQKEGIWTVVYEDLDCNEPQTMVNVYYENGEDLWRLQGYCPSQCYDQYQKLIWQYITDVSFT